MYIGQHINDMRPSVKLTWINGYHATHIQQAVNGMELPVMELVGHRQSQ
jgi:hypothetical protein